MSDPNEIYYATPTHVTRGTAILPDHSWFVPIKRPYGFRFGDERKVGKREAFARAQHRTSETGFTQQIKLIEGPLHGQTMWLIQSCGGSRIWTDHKVILDLRGILHDEPESYESVSFTDREGDWWVLLRAGWRCLRSVTRGHRDQDDIPTSRQTQIRSVEEVIETWGVTAPVSKPQPVLGELVLGELVIGGLVIRAPADPILIEEQIIQGQGPGTVLARTENLELNRWYRVTTKIEAL